MEVKLGQIVDSLPMFEALAANYVFTSRVAYDLSKTLKSCREEDREYKEQVEAIQKRFIVEDSGKKMIPPDKMDAYKGEVNALRDKPVAVWGKAPITLTVLENAIRQAHRQQKPDDKDFEPMLPPSLFAELDWLISEDEVSEPEKEVTKEASA